MSAQQNAASDEQTRSGMNDMYRWTRHVYDATRKYYLLGRDHLINNLGAKDGENIIEVGCGTARNLVKMAKAYPNAQFYGLDASDEMLKTAQQNTQGAKLSHPIPLQQGYAQNFSPEESFGLKDAPQKLVFSYALSIIPPWKESIDHAIELLPKGGEIHIVDFGGQHGLPKMFRAFLFWWLRLFHVYYKPEILEHFKDMDADGKGALSVQDLYRGYAFYAVFKKS